MNFIQKCETIKPNLVIIHIPLQNFSWANLHPRASLFNIYSNVPQTIENMRDAKAVLEAEGIEVLTIIDVLKRDRKFLLEKAMDSVTYSLESDLKYSSNEEKEQLEFFLSDQYKRDTLNHYSDDDLIEIILNRPTCHLSSEAINTRLILKTVEFQPLGNMIFCRDHQIITPRGVILGNLNSQQRKREADLIRCFYELLKIPLIGEIKGENKLEGGDFMILKEDLALLGIGMRTNFSSAVYMMENDLLNTKKFGLVTDENDFDQHRMHLDTFFNILSPNEVFLLDFDTIKPKKYLEGKELNLRRRVQIYERKEVKKTYGFYEIVEEMDFSDFLVKEGFRVIKITHEQQSDFMVNFLNIGDGKVISPNKDMQSFLEKNGSKVAVKYVDIGEVTKMYGAFHCATQAVRY